MEGMLWVILVEFFALFLWFEAVKNYGKVDGVYRDVDRYGLTSDWKESCRQPYEEVPYWVSAGDVTWESAP